MIYSIGYQGIKNQEEFIEILKDRAIEVLLDVRSKPFSRKKGFSKGTLRPALLNNNIIYAWAGETLGGLSEITEEAIKLLSGYQDGKTVCIMCMEADPNKCHRKTEIARRLKAYGVTVEHIIV